MPIDWYSPVHTLSLGCMYTLKHLNMLNTSSALPIRTQNFVKRLHTSCINSKLPVHTPNMLILKISCLHSILPYLLDTSCAHSTLPVHTQHLLYTQNFLYTLITTCIQFTFYVLVPHFFYTLHACCSHFKLPVLMKIFCKH